MKTMPVAYRAHLHHGRALERRVSKSRPWLEYINYIIGNRPTFTTSVGRRAVPLAPIRHVARARWKLLRVEPVEAPLT